MKKSVVCSLAVIAAALANLSASACTAIIVGKKASATGHVLIGHNDDGDGKFMRHAMLPRRGEIPAMFWSEVKSFNGKDRVAHCFYNEYGVFVTSNNGGIMNKWGDETFSIPDEGEFSTVTDGGIDYNLRVRMIEKARTAREGVELMAALVEKHGYAENSRNFIVADGDEAWIVEVIKGRRYFARRVPDDEVTVYPNCLIFNRVREGDVVSANIRAKGPDFDVIGFYQGPRTWKSPYNLHRWQDMYRIAAGVNVEAGAEYPFSVKPAHPVSMDDIKRGLSSHYEGTDYETKPHHPAKSPTTIAPICRASTLEALAAELTEKPVDAVFELTVGRPCEVPFGVYRPFAGVLPADTVFGTRAVERLESYRLPPADRVKVAIYTGKGPRSNGCTEWLRLISSSPDAELTLVDGDAVRSGALKGQDLLVIPGGDSRTIKKDLGAKGGEVIRGFVRSGGGYVGTCAGCCLALDAKADPERGIGLIPYHRIGHKDPAMVSLAFNEAGAKALGIAAESRPVRYSKGPVLEAIDPADPDMHFETWGVFDGDVADEKVKFAMKGHPAVVGGTFGKGRVFAIASHPESFTLTRDILRGALRFVAGREVRLPERTRVRGALSVGFFTPVIAGVTAAQAILQLEATENIDLFPLAADEINRNMLDHVDVVVLPDGVTDWYGKYAKLLASSLEAFVARGGKVLAWGAGAKHLPRGGIACASFGELFAALH